MREYKAKGTLTTTLYAVVGLDDAVSLIVFGIVLPISIGIITGSEAFSLNEMILHPMKEIGLSILIGIVGGWLMLVVHRFVKTVEDTLVMSVGLILLFGGLANHFHLSLILTSMTVGIVAVNWSRIKTRSILNSMKGFAPPIYVIFFVTAGAKLNISLLPTIGILGLIYIITRAVGKYAGSVIGGLATKAEPKVTKYLGLGLLDQAGVAIGLAIAISHKFNDIGIGETGAEIVNVVTAAVFVTMIIAPIFIKMAVIRSGEAN